MQPNNELTASATMPEMALDELDGATAQETSGYPRNTRVEVFRTREEIERLRAVWEKWQSHPNSDIDAYLTVLRALPGGADPLAFVLYENESPRAMLVGRVENGDLTLRIGYKDIAKVSARKMVFIYGGLLGTPNAQNCKALMQAVRSLLKEGHAQVAFFNSLPIDSPLYEAAVSQSFWTRDHAATFQLHRRMTLPANASEFYRGLSSKVRKNLGWQARKFEKDFDGLLRLNCFHRAEDLAEMFRDVETIATKTYQRGLGVGFESNPVLRDRLTLEAQRGWLRAFVLYVNNRPSAFWIGKIYGETFYSDFMGYDPEFAKYSPGMYLVTRVIERFCDSINGDAPEVIDFGLGDAQYKSVLGTSEWQEASLHLFAPTLAGLSLNIFRTPAALLNRFGQRMLDKESVLKLKRAWRSRVRPQARQ